MLNMLEEGTTSLNSTQLAEAQERLGATIGTGASLDRTAVTLTALTPALGAVARPARRRRPQSRLRAGARSSASASSSSPASPSELTQPAGIALRALPGVLYGTQHPYGKPFTGTGDPAVVRALTRDELVRFHQSWIRPDNATIFAVGDMPLSELTPLLERRFGNWRAPRESRGASSASTPRPRRRGRGSC